MIRKIKVVLKRVLSENRLSVLFLQKKCYLEAIKMVQLFNGGLQTKVRLLENSLAIIKEYLIYRRFLKKNYWLAVHMIQLFEHGISKMEK